MKLIVTRSNLLSALARAVPIAKQKTPMPILSTVLIRAELMQPLTISATNLQQSVTTRAPADIEEQGSICVSARDIEARIKTFPEGPILVFLDGSHLQLTAGKRKHRVPVIDAAEFPTLAPPPADGLTLPGLSLATALDQAKPAASEDADRATIHGVFLELLQDQICVTATDGRRVHFATQPAPGAKPAPGILLPIDSVDAILSALDPKQPVTIGMGDLEFGVRSADTVFTTKTISGTFPPCREFLSRMPPESFSVDRDLLVDALTSVSCGTPDGDNHGKVDVTVGNEELLIQGEGKGSASDTVPIRASSGAQASVSFFTPLLLTPLRSTPTPQIHISPDPLAPIFLVSPHLTAIIMPCRR